MNSICILVKNIFADCANFNACTGFKKTSWLLSLSFLIFFLKIYLLFVILLHWNYICICISAILSVLLPSCKYFNTRIQFNLIFYIEPRRLIFSFRFCLECILMGFTPCFIIAKLQTRSTRHYCSSRNMLY